MQKITPFLWFDHQAEEAAKFYTSIFKNSEVGKIARYGEEASKISKSGRPPGSVLTVEFEIEGQKFVALNGGPLFKFNESISFVVNCETQEEVDYFWKKLTPMADRNHSAVAQRQVRCVMAGRSHHFTRAAQRQRCGKIRTRHESDASDGETRYR
jgi:predicted 3-demethylubiquinone-9 3-methyltransferase (glyoxalase superfamily)